LGLHEKKPHEPWEVKICSHYIYPYNNAGDTQQDAPGVHFEKGISQYNRNSYEMEYSKSDIAVSQEEPGYCCHT